MILTLQKCLNIPKLTVQKLPKELNSIPIIRETQKYIEKMQVAHDSLQREEIGKKDEEGVGNEISVDWEKQFRDEKVKNIKLSKELKDVKNKYKNVMEILKRTAPEQRKYSQGEIKKLMKTIEKKDTKNLKKIQKYANWICKISYVL